MDNTGITPDSHRIRLLVAIASYGEKNMHFLKQVIRNYQNMAMAVDVVVVSEAPKDLGNGVRVQVGLPSKNPWSLPFAHKDILAKAVDSYDLFVYSEDDLGVSEANIKAFLRATAELKPDEIAGFLRYEVDQSGAWLLTEPWGHYHWKTESVRRRGAYTVAEFTNEHAGFYILTQTQLKRAIASGGFLREPYTGRYSWPETAATDPYTSCGFRKVICISDIDDFLIHHMPNRYADGLPVSLSAFKEQIQTLLEIQDGHHPASILCAVESEFFPSRWQKSYYEKPNDEWLRMIPDEAKTVLTIGCGWGATEEKLKQRGLKVTTLPLDSVVGKQAARQGIETIYGEMDECFNTLGERSFDCVLLTNLLHLQPDPKILVEHCIRKVVKGGTLILSGPNFDRAPWFIRRNFSTGEFRRLRRFDSSGISICGPGTLAECIDKNGSHVVAVRWLDHVIEQGWLRGSRISLGRFTARQWILQARC